MPSLDFQHDWVASDVVVFTEYLELEVLTFSGSLFDTKDMARKVLQSVTLDLCLILFYPNSLSEQGIDEAFAFAEEELSRGTLNQFAQQWC